MLDFTSALYLGIGHASWTLPGWPQLTLGKPGALEGLPGTAQAEEELAALTGRQQVVLGASTLHLFCDLFALMARRTGAIWIDQATYPIARWGTDRAAAAGTPVRLFPAHDATALRKALAGARGSRPVVVTDGYCPWRGRPAPLREYARSVAAANGLLVVDDTQALGVLGAGGGGSLRDLGLDGHGIVLVSSLAKAFGAPLAMLGGSREFVDEFRQSSATLVHCSPPSAAVLAAALRALEINRRMGDVLRRRLARRVLRFRQLAADLAASANLFPVQPLRLAPYVDARAVHRALVRRGVRPVLHRDPSGGGPRISFLITARHRLSEIDRAAECLWAAGAYGWRPGRKGAADDVSRTV